MNVTPYRGNVLWMAVGIVLTVLLFLALLFIGAVEIPYKETLQILFGETTEKLYRQAIILETRLPMAICAVCCGACLSVAGLIMQTMFQNPLAGPSVLGVSSGASVGVAAVILGGLTFGSSGVQNIVPLIGASIGAALVIIMLLGFSSLLKNGVMLLIVGIMVSYLCNSAISLLNYFSPAEEIRSYLFWGLGSYTGPSLEESLWFLWFTLAMLLASVFCIKPLNALLLGERHAETLGYSLANIRAWILIVTGLLVAVPTAYCGPIGFIGLIVPHLSRLLLRSSHHGVLIPATIIFGAVISLLCTFLSVLPSKQYGVLPINVITPLIGVPVIVYLLVCRKNILYFK